jgi:hypothetical protein
MIRTFEMIITFILVFVGVLVFGGGGIFVWLAFGHAGLAALGVLAFAVALGWAAAERVADEARRATALKEQRQATREVSRNEPRLEVPPRRRWEPRQSGHQEREANIIEWPVPEKRSTTREPRLFRDADDFAVIEWTEDRKR